MQRRLVRIGFVVANTALLATVLFFVLGAHATRATNLSAGKVAATAGTVSNPLDQVSSADIAVAVSRMTGLAEATAVTNQADSADIALASAPTTNSVVSKPEVVASAFKSNKDIQNYTVQPGDNVASIAAKFSVTSDSIRWSNSISGNAVNAGNKLLIPPLGYSGIVYTVKAGDTIDSIASKYKADKTELIAANDAEISGLQTGERIIIPNGQQPVATYSYASSYSGYAWGTAAIYGSNGYDYGYCTWYVATRVPVPANWGNANTWDRIAPLSGWTVSTTPHAAGDVAQTSRGALGHVAYVEAVSADGSMIKYSDMNGLAGWGRVGNSDWVPASTFQHYIYR